MVKKVSKKFTGHFGHSDGKVDVGVGFLLYMDCPGEGER
jgi:hypothetical protein